MKKIITAAFLATSLSACGAQQNIQVNKAGDSAMSCSEIINEMAAMNSILDTSTQEAAGNLAKTVVNETETVGGKVSSALAENALLRDSVRMFSAYNKNSPEDKAALKDTASQRKDVLQNLSSKKKCG